MNRPRPFRTRLKWVETGALVLFAGLAVRLVDIQVLQHDELSERGRIQWQTLVPVPAERGNIYDRHGRSLALSVSTWRVGVATSHRVARGEGALERVADRVASVLEREPADVRARLRAGAGRHVVLERRAVLHRDSLAVLTSLGAVTLDVQHDRIYPRGGVGASLIGHYRDTGDGAVVNGLEQAFDSMLRGTPGEAWRHRTPTLGPGDGLEIVTPARDGHDVTLTIDADLQAIAETSLADAVVECNAIGGVVLIIDPGTGELLAAADTPVITDRSEAAEHQRFWDNFNFTGS